MDLSEIRKKLRTQIGFRLIYPIFLFINRTSRIIPLCEDNIRPLEKEGKGFILASWHGKTFLPMYYLRGRGYYAIISLSRDGEIQNLMVSKNGFRTIRGSTGRHGAKALAESTKKLREGHVITLTPDGPKGPVRVVQPGAVHMAYKSGCPIIPVGVAASPCKLLKSWDSYLIPKPFATGVIYFSSPIYIQKPSNNEVTNEWIDAESKRIGESIDYADRIAETELQQIIAKKQ